MPAKQPRNYHLGIGCPEVLGRSDDLKPKTRELFWCGDTCQPFARLEVRGSGAALERWQVDIARMQPLPDRQCCRSFVEVQRGCRVGFHYLVVLHYDSPLLRNDTTPSDQI
eukprot:6470473-Amphidinium_carterae.3